MYYLHPPKHYHSVTFISLLKLSFHRHQALKLIFVVDWVCDEIQIQSSNLLSVCRISCQLCLYPSSLSLSFKFFLLYLWVYLSLSFSYLSCPSFCADLTYLYFCMPLCILPPTSFSSSYLSACRSISL